MNKLVFVLLGYLLLSITGCSSVPQNDSLATLKHERSQLQRQLSELTDEVWLRQGELIVHNTPYPLNSESPQTIASINAHLRNQIGSLEQKIQRLNQAVLEQYIAQDGLSQLQLIAIFVEDHLAQQYTAEPLMIEKGEQKSWRLMQQDRWLDLMVTWSTAGNLSIEGQSVTQLLSEQDSQAFVTSVRWYDGNIQAQGELTLNLQPVWNVP